MNLNTLTTISSVLREFSGPYECKLEGEGKVFKVNFDIRYKAQAFAIMLKEELAKRGLLSKVTCRRVNRYQVNITEH